MFVSLCFASRSEAAWISGQTLSILAVFRRFHYQKRRFFAGVGDRLMCGDAALLPQIHAQMPTQPAILA
jgi:hypothetical protein